MVVPDPVNPGRGQGSSRPRIAVVIVTYNSQDVLAGCLESLPGGCAGVDLTAVVIADNNSADGTVEVARTAAAALGGQIVTLGRNAGYAAGINAGIRRLAEDSYDAVLVINPDCRLRPGAAAALAAALDRPGVGISAPRLVHPDGSLQPTLRRRATVTGALAESVLGGHLADRLGVGELIFSASAHQRAGVVSWATGAALMISRATVERVGEWDESFLLYSEETEFILRAADRGFALRYEPTAVVEHIGGQSAVHPGLAALLAANKVELYRRRHGWVSAVAYRSALLVGAAVRSLTGHPTARATAGAILRPTARISRLEDMR